ncbi:uncharacterized protein LOC143453023 [Clavelina lepadiformis]|uniref:uncharacterized protein LOC143453023 n=1 Tax=Clavelina lepadiformis TaxID=159417 RepID=UPI0040410D22
MDKQDDDEKELINELKNEHCYANGREKSPQEAAKIFHKLGLAYMKKTNDKISLIQSAALLNAALARIPDNVEGIESDLRHLCSLVLKAAGAYDQTIDLTEKAKIIGEQVKQMRDRVNKKLPKLKTIPDDVDDEILCTLESLKIAFMKRLQKEITKDYKSIMAQVYQYCIDIMGESPCLHALSGMGSLARGEITPYSDFEHIIVLEEGVQHMDDYNEIQEYFRWFSVIFQIILICLNETILPSVSIPFLNDFSSEDENWFYDAHTTRGISFDGMIPHACKFPLGRPETEAKPWKTELIKPVSEMVMYLEQEEDFKNGYHLADIMTKTCYVSGSEQVYSEFYKASRDTLQQNEASLTQLTEEISEDLDNFATRMTLSSLISKKEFNVKKVIYRSTTLFVSALGRLHDIEATSCFDIINELKEKSVLSPGFEHKLAYAVAVACEVRLKVYMSKKSQDDWLNDDDTSKSELKRLLEAVGERSLIEYFKIAYSLQYDLTKYLKIRDKEFWSNPVLVSISIFYFLKLYDRALEIPLSSLARLLHFNIQGQLPDQFTPDPLGNNHIGECFHMLIMVDKLIKQTIKQDARSRNKSSSNEEMLNLLVLVANIMKSVNKIDEAYENYSRALTLCEKIQSSEEIILSLHLAISDCLRCMWRIDEALSHAQNCHEYLKLTCGNSAKFEDVLKLAHASYSYGSTLRGSNNYIESINITKEVQTLLYKIPKSFRSKQVQTLKTQCVSLIGACHAGLENVDKALSYLQQALDWYLNNTEIENFERNAAFTSLNIGNCLMRQKSPNLAMLHFQKSLDLHRTFVNNEETNLDIAFLRNSFGLCCMHLGKCHEGLEYLNLALKAFNSTKKFTNKTTILSNAHCLVSICHVDARNYKEASKHYTASLALVNNHHSGRTENTEAIGKFLFDIIDTSFKEKKYNIALTKAKCALRFCKRIICSTSELNMNNIFVFTHNIGKGLMKQEKFEQALKPLKACLDMARDLPFAEKNKEMIESDIILCKKMLGNQS